MPRICNQAADLRLSALVWTVIEIAAVLHDDGQPVLLVLVDTMG